MNQLIALKTGGLRFVVSHPFAGKTRMDGARRVDGRESDRAEESAAFFAAGHDGGVEALAEAGGQVVDLM